MLVIFNFLLCFVLLFFEIPRLIEIGSGMGEFKTFFPVGCEGKNQESCVRVSKQTCVGVIDVNFPVVFNKSESEVGEAIIKCVSEMSPYEYKILYAVPVIGCALIDT